MHQFNQHSLSLKVRVVIRSYLHAEQTKTYCIYNVVDTQQWPIRVAL